MGKAGTEVSIARGEAAAETDWQDRFSGVYPQYEVWYEENRKFTRHFL